MLLFKNCPELLGLSNSIKKVKKSRVLIFTEHLIKRKTGTKRYKSRLK